MVQPQQSIAVSEVAAQAMVTVMEFSIFAQAMGILIASSGLEAGFTAPPTRTKATQKAIHELREAFPGSDAVERAIKDTGTDNIVALAKRVEVLYKDYLIEQYGEWATQHGLAACPSGDLRCVHDVAATMKARSVSPESSPAAVASATASGVVRAASAKKRVRYEVLDTKTNTVYRSQAAAGMAVAPEYGMDGTNTYVWFDVIRTAPARFKRRLKEGDPWVAVP
ncbi:hypothetical protein KKH23_06970 [Patescibacteria group bacterium]|nr:hypothetical protein [Patescibacteria group bacterium]